MSPLVLILIVAALGLGVFLLRSLARGRDYSAGAAPAEKRATRPPDRVAEGMEPDSNAPAGPTYAYCPECGDEYFSDVTHCVDCKVPLTSEPPARDRDDPQSFVRLVESQDTAYLTQVRRALTAAGIYHLADRESVGLTGDFGGVRVRSEDQERAAEVLFELQRNTTDFGDDFNTWSPDDDPEVLRAWEEQGGVHELDADFTDSMESESD